MIELRGPTLPSSSSSFSSKQRPSSPSDREIVLESCVLLIWVVLEAQTVLAFAIIILEHETVIVIVIGTDLLLLELIVIGSGERGIFPNSLTSRRCLNTAAAPGADDHPIVVTAATAARKFRTQTRERCGSLLSSAGRGHFATKVSPKTLIQRRFFEVSQLYTFPHSLKLTPLRRDGLSVTGLVRHRMLKMLLDVRHQKRVNSRRLRHE